MVAWAKENAKSSGLDAPIRWIVDDCVKFVEREIRRETTKATRSSWTRPPWKARRAIWKIEDADLPVSKALREAPSDKPLFYLINSYTTGLARPCPTCSNSGCPGSSAEP